MRRIKAKTCKANTFKTLRNAYEMQTPGNAKPRNARADKCLGNATANHCKAKNYTS